MKVRVLCVYKNSAGKHVAVDVQDCDSGKLNFIELGYFISEVKSKGINCDNFIVVQNSYVQGKSGNQLKFESLLTLSEIYSKYPHKHVKLGKIIWKNNKRLGTILFASVAFIGTGEDNARDIIRSRETGEDPIWLCTADEDII